MIATVIPPGCQLCDVCRERGKSCPGEWDQEKQVVECTRFVDVRNDERKSDGG